MLLKKKIKKKVHNGHYTVIEYVCTSFTEKKSNRDLSVFKLFPDLFIFVLFLHTTTLDSCNDTFIKSFSINEIEP